MFTSFVNYNMLLPDKISYSDKQTIGQYALFKNPFFRMLTSEMAILNTIQTCMSAADINTFGTIGGHPIKTRTCDL